MVAGIKFLSKKGFNPQNLSNQKRVWEAEQQRKDEVRRARDRQEQLQRERDDEELARARGDVPKLNFMYAAPPGMETEKKAGVSEHDDRKPAPPLSSSAGTISSSTGLTTERQPGDDDAAAAFRRMLASADFSKDEESNDSGKVAAASQQTSFGTVLQGSSVEASTSGKDEKEGRSALEKAVGRRNSGQALSYEEQIQRFPALANAPRARGMAATDVGVTFKPLGTQIRNVKCMVCGIWGHSRGDRECQKSGWDPFSLQRPQQEQTTQSRVSDKDDDERKHKTEGRGRGRERDDWTSPDDNSSSSDSSHESRRRKRKRSKRSRKDRRRSREDDDSCSSSDRGRKPSRETKKKRKRKRSKSKRGHQDQRDSKRRRRSHSDSSPEREHSQTRKRSRGRDDKSDRGRKDDESDRGRKNEAKSASEVYLTDQFERLSTPVSGKKNRCASCTRPLPDGHTSCLCARCGT